MQSLNERPLSLIAAIRALILSTISQAENGQERTFLHLPIRLSSAIEGTFV
jgi:hypothetical protein